MWINAGAFLLAWLGVISAMATVLYVYLNWKFQYWRKRNVHFIDTNEVHILINREKMREIYNVGKSKGWRHFGICVVIKPVWIPTDLKLIKNVLTKDFYCFADRGLYFNERDDPISANIFMLGGKRWKQLREKVTPAFSSGKLKAMFQTLTDCGLQMELYIERNIDPKGPVDIKEIFGRFSTDVVGSAIFGVECNTFIEPDSPFREYAKKFLARDIFVDMGHIVGNISPSLAKALKLRIIQRDVSAFYTKIVEETVTYRLKNNVTRKDFLQLLIDMMSDTGRKAMTGIVAQCFLFFIAGFESSSTTMSFALYELATRPEIQEKVREELQRVLAKYNDQINYDSLNELTYLKQVIEETLRLYPPVPILLRECSKDYIVPDEDVVIKKGTRVVIPVTGLHYDDQFFKNPQQFDPERFSPENRKNIPQYAYMPFGEGPRVCIAERFGIMQVKVGLACFLRKFRVGLNTKTRVPLKLSTVSFFPLVEGGIWLDLEKL